MDQRKLRILQAIIDDYILTAAPIGSRTISKHSDIGLSSATIRNEMSDLEEMGYLDQPHTSAGRIPSAKAYRLYVDHLMQSSGLSEKEIVLIRAHAEKRIVEAEEIIAQTARVLAELTQYPSMVMAPQWKNSTIKHIQIVPVSDSRALAVIVNDAGALHNVMMRVPSAWGSVELERFSHLLTARLNGQMISEAVELLRIQMTPEMLEHREFFDSLTKALSQQEDLGARDRLIAVGGTTKLLNHPEFYDVEKARSMLAVLETKENLYRILGRAQNMKFTVTIGPENEIEEMRDSSVVTATYEIDGVPVGSFGVIGPTRMNYSKVVSILQFMGLSLGEIFSSMIHEGEK